MKKYRAFHHLVRLCALIGVLTILSACPSPLAETVPADQIDDGLVVTQQSGISVTVPVMASWLAEAFKEEAALPDAVQNATSRAFCVSDAVDLIVRDSGGVEIGRVRFSRGLDPAPTFTGTINVPAGTGYSVQVDIFNVQVSDTVPVVSGSASGVSVNQGQTTPLTIGCLPVAPTQLTLGTDSSFSLLPFVMQENGTPESNGGEVWFQFDAPSSGYVNIAPTLLEGVQYAAGLFDASGYPLSTTIYSTAVRSAPLSVGGLVPHDRYYLVFLVAAPDATPRELFLRIEELAATYLTEAEVPDPELRQLLEFYTGKHFTTASNPNPSDPVSDLDLAAITAEIRTDGYNGGPELTGITNLTGLEYCDGTRFLLLNGNDLSGNDAHLEVLAGMNSLSLIDAVNCSLGDAQPLAVLHNLVQLKIWGNPELDLTELLRLNSTALPNLKTFGFSPWDTDSDGDIDPVPAADFSQLADMLAQHLELDKLYMVNGPTMYSDAMFQELYDEVLSVNLERWQVLDFNGSNFSGDVADDLANLTSLQSLVLGGNTLLTDISWISAMTWLQFASFNGSAITSIEPLQQLYDAGGLRIRHPWYGFDLDLKNCASLVFSEGSTNRTALQYLIDRFVRVEHDQSWVSPGPSWVKAFANPEGAYIHGMAWDGTALRMVSRSGNEILRVNPETGLVLDRIPAPVASGGTGLAWDGTNLWYTHDYEAGGTLGIYQVSPSDGAVLSSFDAPYEGDSTGLAWDGTHLWNTGFGGALYRLDTGGTQVSSITAPNNIPEGLDYDLVRGVLLHIDYNGVFYEIDPVTGKILFSIDAPGTHAYGVTFDGNFIWVSSDDGNIYKLDIIP